MGHTGMGTGTGTDFQTRGHTTPVTAVSQVFTVLQANPLSKELFFFLFFMIFHDFFKQNFQKRMILMAGALLA